MPEARHLAPALPKLPSAGRTPTGPLEGVPLLCYAKSMPEVVPRRMTADEFLAWATQRPDGERLELAAGEVVAMAPEQAGHGRVKGNIYRSLRDAIDAGGPQCEAYVDRMAVEVDKHSVYEPDVLLRSGG